MFPSRTAIIVSNAVFLCSYALTYPPNISEQLSLCAAITLWCGISHYITRASIYWVFLQRVWVMQEADIKEHNSGNWFNRGLLFLSVFSFVVGLLQTIFSKPFVNTTDGCDLFVESIFSIVCLALFLASDTILTLTLLYLFIDPLNQSIQINETYSKSDFALQRAMKMKFGKEIQVELFCHYIQQFGDKYLIRFVQLQ